MHHSDEKQNTYKTLHGITIIHTSTPIPYENAVENLIDSLDSCKGALFTSSFEYPGRYTRWDIGFKNPNLEIVTNQNQFTITALNQRGEILIPAIREILCKENHISINHFSSLNIQGHINYSDAHFTEEERSKQPSIFTVIRTLISFFYSEEDRFLGLYGAFGYDLCFQFEAIEKKMHRDRNQRDIVLYLPDEITVVDHQRRTAKVHHYDFNTQTKSTVGLEHSGEILVYSCPNKNIQGRDHAPGDYAKIVEIAKQSFKKGDLFEVVPGQLFYEPSQNPPSELFRRLRQRNPAPYGFFINLGQQEYLVGASPEMYVKVSGNRVETSPISGTISRGKDAMSDAEQIFKLLSSKKDESELTMCTDVDRNDKSRICEPASVKVIGRRLIEMYSRLIHTVDHVEGILRPEYDALDAFLTHMWVVTVTGAPKKWAMEFIENHEKTPRRWYAGAVGWMNFDGNMNTGLTLRTIRLDKGIAEVRVGATLLYDSIPEEEEKETELKGSALFNAIREPLSNAMQQDGLSESPLGKNKTILLVDHQDSFVHTLANYFRQTGAKVTTLRSGFTEADLDKINPDLMVLSPGPGSPTDFNLHETIDNAVKRHIPIFGVCLGLQGIVEYFGGKLGVLDYPMHGKPATIHHQNSQLFVDMPSEITVGLYHSLYALDAYMPNSLIVSARSKQNIIMAIEHCSLPIWAVQFHPESIMSLGDNAGIHIIYNVMRMID